MLLLSRLEDLPDNLFIDLDHYGILSVCGDDAAKFLHSQLTVDVNKLQTGQVRRFAHCDFKGKCWNTGLVAKSTNQFYLISEQPALTETQNQLAKYGVFSKADISDESKAYTLHFAKGKQALTLIREWLGTNSIDTMQIDEQAHGFYVHLDTPNDCALVAVANSALTDFAAKMTNGEIPKLHNAAFEALSIQHGIPAIVHPEHILQFVPQMMNLQVLNAIDFNKGCYMGQEVVARTRYLGKNKRAAYIFKANSQMNDVENASLEMAIGDHWRTGGTILRYACLANETWLLAIVNNTTSQQDKFRLSTFPDITLIHGELPYTLET